MSEAANNKAGLGLVSTTARGFDRIEFFDKYGTQCSLQQSSLAEHEEPGTSAVWLGVDDVSPQVLASEARSVGVVTAKNTGCVPYPIPPNVLLTSRMHLDREQVSALIMKLQNWLDGGTFAAKGEQR